MTILTNRSGGKVKAEGSALEALKRAGWTEETPVQPSEPKPEATKTKPAPRTRKASTPKAKTES